MTVTILCLVVLLQLAWVWLLKLDNEDVRRQLAMLRGINTPSPDDGRYSGQKGMRRIVIGKDGL